MVDSTQKDVGPRHSAHSFQSAPEVALEEVCQTLEMGWFGPGFEMNPLQSMLSCKVAFHVSGFSTVCMVSGGQACF